MCRDTSTHKRVYTHLTYTPSKTRRNTQSNTHTHTHKHTYTHAHVYIREYLVHISSWNTTCFSKSTYIIIIISSSICNITNSVIIIIIVYLTWFVFWSPEDTTVAPEDVEKPERSRESTKTTTTTGSDVSSQSKSRSLYKGMSIYIGATTSSYTYTQLNTTYMYLCVVRIPVCSQAFSHIRKTNLYYLMLYEFIPDKPVLDAR